jgi:hypothetical protein
MIKEVHIPNFYADRLQTSKWIRVKKKDKYRCYICLRARKKFKIVPMDPKQRQAIDEVLRSFGFTSWEAERKIAGGINTKCGYFIYVPLQEFEELKPSFLYL